MKRPWSISLATKIFLSYLAVVVLLFAGFYLFSSDELKNAQITEISRGMAREARFIARVLPFDLKGPALDTLCRQLAGDLGIRITVIGSDGTVLGDSAEQSATMVNHAARSEVVESIRSGSGSAIRYSTTVSREMLYHALYQPGFGTWRVVRLAKPLTEVERSISALRWSLLSGLLLASASGLLLAWFFSRHLTLRFQRLERFAEQVAEGSFPQNFFPARTRDEISILEQRLNDMSLKIRDNLREIITEKEKADSILRCMVEGVIVLDPEGAVMLMNDQAKAMFDAPPGREGSHLSMLEISRHPEVHKILKEVLSLDLSDARYVKEVELDNDRWFRVNAVRLRDGQGHSRGSILVFHDVTDIKRFATIRSDFVANVSHELRTPLTAIRGYVETLLHSPPEDPQDNRQFLEIIDRHSERLTRLTEDLLILSDLESGKVRPSIHPTEVKQLIQRVLEVFWDRASKKGVSLVHNIEPELPSISGDLDRLQQLFINLVDNAVKYTPSGGAIILTANRVSGHNGGAQVEITVSDTGPGIPEKDLPRLTERFYRVEKARSRDLGGTGLGLAIVKHIVQAHRGELKFESVVGKGTTVRVCLPAVVTDEHPSAILFLCDGNSSLSQMAGAFARQITEGKQQILSASIQTQRLHPSAVLVMREVGVDISDETPITLDAIPLAKVGHVVTLGGDIGTLPPPLSSQAIRSYWPIADRAAAAAEEDQGLSTFRKARDEIRSRVRDLLSEDAHHSERLASRNIPITVQ